MHSSANWSQSNSSMKVMPDPYSFAAPSYSSIIIHHPFSDHPPPKSSCSINVASTSMSGPKSVSCMLQRGDSYDIGGPFCSKISVDNVCSTWCCCLSTILWTVTLTLNYNYPLNCNSLKSNALSLPGNTMHIWHVFRWLPAIKRLNFCIQCVKLNEGSRWLCCIFPKLYYNKHRRTANMFGQNQWRLSSAWAEQDIWSRRVVFLMYLGKCLIWDINLFSRSIVHISLPTILFDPPHNYTQTIAWWLGLPLELALFSSWINVV